jgi:hypothetical protein
MWIVHSKIVGHTNGPTRGRFGAAFFTKRARQERIALQAASWDRSIFDKRPKPWLEFAVP